MVAIFNNIDSALRYSDSLHAWLLQNRTGYIADRWEIPYKNDLDDLWAIQLPEEQERLPVTELILQSDLMYAVLKVGGYPEGWSQVVLSQSDLFPHADRPIRVYITHAQVTAMIESPYKALIDYALSVPYVKDDRGITLWLEEFENEMMTAEQVRGVLEGFGAIITVKI